MVAMMGLLPAILPVILFCPESGRFRSRSFNDFIQLTSVEPNSPASGAVINFDTLTFRKKQIGTT